MGSAILSGKLVRLPCEMCGDKKSEGHHTDYGEPLKVSWLCRKHHEEWHRNNPPVPGYLDIVMLEVTVDTRQKIKVIASLEAMTIPQFMKSLIDLAYDAQIKNHQASARSKRAMSA